MKEFLEQFKRILLISLVLTIGIGLGVFIVIIAIGFFFEGNYIYGIVSLLVTNVIIASVGSLLVSI